MLSGGGGGGGNGQVTRYLSYRRECEVGCPYSRYVKNNANISYNLARRKATISNRVMPRERERERERERVREREACGGPDEREVLRRTLVFSPAP